MDEDRFIVIQFGNLPLIIYKAKRGYIATCHINKESAEKLGDVAAVVPCVKKVEEFKKQKLREVTKWAEEFGLRKGMTVKRAARILDEET